MKRYFLFCAVLLCTAIVVSADDNKFYNALQTCSPYSDGGQVSTEGMNVSFKNEIVGKSGDKCIYKEIVNFSGINSCTTCKFSQKQIDELVKVMRAYSTVMQYSEEKVDVSKLSNVQNNPVVKVWNKYLQDSSICTMEYSK